MTMTSETKKMFDELEAKFNAKLAEQAAVTEKILHPNGKPPTAAEWAATLDARKQKDRLDSKRVNDAARLQNRRSRKAELEAILPKLQAEHADLIETLKDDDGTGGLDLDLLRGAGLVSPIRR
jgi:hypothetical protein